MRVLGLNHAGIPMSWLSFEEAATYYVSGKVAWSLGDPIRLMKGGTQKNGERSMLYIDPIIAVRGERIFTGNRNVTLSNRNLFNRDRHTCAYCGKQYSSGTYSRLSRDHIIPTSKKGKDTWMNVVTACIDCNIDKADRTLEESGMELLYAPYIPNHNEYMILRNRNILSDQMDFLLVQGVSDNFKRRMKMN